MWIKQRLFLFYLHEAILHFYTKWGILHQAEPYYRTAVHSVWSGLIAHALITKSTLYDQIRKKNPSAIHDTRLCLSCNTGADRQTLRECIHSQPSPRQAPWGWRECGGSKCNDHIKGTWNSTPNIFEHCLCLTFFQDHNWNRFCDIMRWVGSAGKDSPQSDCKLRQDSKG